MLSEPGHKTLCQSKEGSRRGQPNRSARATALKQPPVADVSSATRFSPGLSAEEHDHTEIGEAKIFGGRGRNEALHPGRVMFHGLQFIYFVGSDVN